MKSTDITVFPGRLDGSVRAIPSKSHAHRALICAALADKPTFIKCMGESGDITATIACLRALGAEITYEPGGYEVTPLAASASHPRGQGSELRGHETEITHPASRNSAFCILPSAFDNSEAVILRCGESGSTFRFLLPIACALGRNVSFLPEGRLPERPLSPLRRELVSHGCTLSPQGSVPFLTSGQLLPGNYSLEANVSSQFISGLLFALPLLDGDSELRLTGRIESFPYVGLTMSMLEVFCIKTEFDGDVFRISGNQVYRSPGELCVEGDWSNAAFWLSAGIIGGGCVTCTGLDLHSRQGDREIIDILKRFGASLEAGASAVTASGGFLQGVDIDASDIPDLVPILAVVASAAEGLSVIRNAGRLRDKESDRLAAVSYVLRELGADIRETEDGLIIRGGTALASGQVSSMGDHRIVMAAAIAASICSDPVGILGAEAVSKSYPGFFDDMRSLGGKVIMHKT